MVITTLELVDLEVVVLVENLHLLQEQVAHQTLVVAVEELVVAVHILMDKVVRVS